MEIDRRELKQQARERMFLTEPRFWVVALAYIAMTTGVSWLFSLIPTPGVGASPVPYVDTMQLFLRLLLMLYTTVVQFGLCLWSLWTYRQLGPGINSLIQGFSVAGRVLLMELGIAARIAGWYLCVALVLSIPTIVILSSTYSQAVATVTFVLFFLALITTIITLYLRYALAPYLLADRPDDGPSVPIFRSVVLMRGWKMELFKLEFSFIGWDLINLLLSAAVSLFFLYQAGLLAPGFTLDAAWADACSDVIHSMPVVTVSSLITIPVSLWLLPYRSTARAGFYDARLAAARTEQPEMPPL